MYQYGNVAEQYRKENKDRPLIQHQKRPAPQQDPAPKVLSTGEKVIYLLTVIMIVITLSLLLMRSATISKLNYEIQSLEAEKVKIEERNSHLHLQVDELSSPERIMQIAKEEWGLDLHESTVRILSIPSLETEERSVQKANKGEGE